MGTKELFAYTCPSGCQVPDKTVEGLPSILALAAADVSKFAGRLYGKEPVLPAWAGSVSGSD
jgi:hypothetical protein